MPSGQKVEHLLWSHFVQQCRRSPRTLCPLRDQTTNRGYWFLAPFLQFMPLTGEAGILGALIPQLKPSVADYGYKPQRFSSFLPSQPLTKWRFLAASPLSCLLCNQEIPRHSSPMCAYPCRAWTWNRDLEPTLNKFMQWFTIRFQTLLL